MVHSSMYEKALFVLIGIQQSLDIESISRELAINIEQLEELLKSLVDWGLVSINETEITYTLTHTGKNIIRYNEEEQTVSKRTLVNNA